MHSIGPLHQLPIPHHPGHVRENKILVLKRSYRFKHKLPCQFRDCKVHSERLVITLPMPSAVCSARISLRTFTASLRVAGRQLQRTTSANPSTTCSTLDRGLRSRDRERLLPELCILKKMEEKKH